jgi:hypothetical protein
VLARGLAKQPQDRYSRCGDFAAALRETLFGAGRLAGASTADAWAGASTADGWPGTSTADRWAGAGAGSAAGPAPTRFGSAPRGSRPPHVPETAVWSDTAGGAGATETFPPPSVLADRAPSASAGGTPSPDIRPSSPWSPPPAAAAGAQQTWPARPAPGAAVPTPAFPTPAASPAPAASPSPGGRPVTTRPAPPPPAAGQGGKLPLVSRSAVIAALAAVAALVLLYLLHGAG